MYSRDEKNDRINSLKTKQKRANVRRGPSRGGAKKKGARQRRGDARRLGKAPR